MSTRPEDQPDVARWDETYTPTSPTPVFDSIMRRFLTSAYPHEVDATTIWPTWDLAILAEHLQLGPGATMLDLPCGMGQIGLWVSGRLGCSVLGADPSPVGLERAREHAKNLDRTDASYLEGHFLDLPLPDASMNGLLSVDGIHFSTDVPATFREMRRVLHDGARCVIVGAEALQPERWPRWSRAIANEGFEVVHEETTPDWFARFQTAWRTVGENEDAIRAEAVDGGDGVMGHVERAAKISDDVIRHALVVAEAR